MTSDLRRARDRFLSDREVVGVRDPISTSWRRSLAQNVSADRLELPYVREPNLDTPLVAAADPVLRQLADGLRDEPVCAVLTSADGVVLNRIASDSALNSALDEVRLAPGYSYSEAFAGTNGIGTTLETRRPTLVSGAEHYTESLVRLSCAGVPIIHPVSGTLVGAIDLTGWADHGGEGVMRALAMSASREIEHGLLALSSARETMLLNAYLRTCRRSPQLGVLAVGVDMVLMNNRLRQALGPQDQTALLEHAVDVQENPGHALVAALPGGRNARLTRVHADSPLFDEYTGLFVVHLIEQEKVPATAARPRVALNLPGLVGDSLSWRRCVSQLGKCVQSGQWTAVAGEVGTGRAALLKAAMELYHPGFTQIFGAEDLRDEGMMSDLADELEHERFNIILRDIDQLDEQSQEVVAGLLQGHEHGGVVGVTVTPEETGESVGALILPMFAQTVSVPALRHRIEDLEQLVPALLRQISRGGDVSLSAAALRQLAKLSWPGNIAQLRRVLTGVVQTRRTGVVDLDQLPAECRTVGRHKLSHMESIERDAIVRSLDDNRGNKVAAATELGISRATIYRKIRQYGIDV